MKKAFLAILLMFMGMSSVFADDNADALSMEAEYQQKIKEIKGEAAQQVPSQTQQQTEAELAAKQARQAEILKKQEELRFIFSPKQDKQGNPVIPFIMPQGQTIQIPFVSHIPYFFSYVEIFYDGKMMVKETIDMVFTSKAYRKAFIRELNTVYEARDGSKRKLDIAVKSVVMNQTKLPFYVTNFGDKLQIIARPPENGEFLDGVSTFYIQYVVDGAVFFTPDFDDISLNVIGNGFKVPIARAGMSVIFPRAPVVRAQTQDIGSDENPNIALKIDRDDEGNLAFAISDPLVPGDHFTVNLTIDKGILVAPSASDMISAEIRKYAFVSTALLGLLIIFLRCLFSYRDAKKNAGGKSKTVGFSGYASSALLYTFAKKKFDDKAFAHAIVGMAAKGSLNVENTEGGICLNKGSEGVAMNCEEKAAFSALFKHGDKVMVSDKPLMKKAFSSLKRATLIKMLVSKLKANKEDVISITILVLLLAFLIGVQTYNQFLTMLFCVGIMVFSAFSYLLFRSFMNALTLNVFSAKGGIKKMVFYIIEAVVLILLLLAAVAATYAFTSIGCAIVLIFVGLVIGKYPSFLREHRCDKKIFDLAGYGEYLNTVFAKIDNPDEALSIYKRHMSSSMVAGVYAAFTASFKGKNPDADVDGWYTAKDKPEGFINGILKAISDSVA